jgi:ankyrin repeat protein
LLSRKANPNAKAVNGSTPLASASIAGARSQRLSEATRIAVADLLLQSGADVNELFKGSSPRAIAAAGGFYELANYLRKHGGKCVASSNAPKNCRD